MLFTPRCSIHMSSEMQATLLFHSYIDLNFTMSINALILYLIMLLAFSISAVTAEWGNIQCFQSSWWNLQHLRRQHSRSWTITRYLYAVHSFHCSL